MAATSIARVRQQVIDAINASEWQTATGVGITSAAAVLTSDSVFVATDAGKNIQVLGAGAAGATLYTTILTYTSATQVTLAANAGTTVVNSSATFGGRIDDQARSLLDVEYAIVDADAEIVRTILETYGHPQAASFMAASSTLAHGDEIPEYVGRYGAIEIQVHASDGWKLGIPASRTQIEQWRTNTGSIFGTTAHNATTSYLGGYFHVSDNHIYFTGANARIYVPSFSPTYAPPTCQSPDTYEHLVRDGAIAKLQKEGDSSEVFTQARTDFAQGLAAIRSRNVITPPTEQEEAA